MRLIELMFSDPLTEIADILAFITGTLSDLQSWDELTEAEKADLFGKMIGAKQSIDHCLRVNFQCDPESTPKRFEDIPGSDNIDWSGTPVVDGRFIDHVETLLKGDRE